DPNGQRIGGGLTVIWSRASEFIQTPGHAHDLGIELDARLYYQSKDGALNDVPDQMGGFFAMFEYGVLFPMSGLGYPSNEAAAINSQLHAGAADTNVAQTLRLYLGVFF
ncbi:MAG TPA: TIGR04551 family protein, partial [Polyangiaceae bacterium]|nr:TIGR04551 family protein [Polyangiaceae bacterium]